MQYIPVTGLGPVKEVKNIILNHFGAALISIAEPTTSKGWTIHQIYRQVDKIFKNFAGGEELYLDSGGFQVLMGYISKTRMNEFIDVYHFILDRFSDSISKNTKIFSLDILNKKFTEDEIFEFNKNSIQKSIALLKKKPELKESQLFVVQSRFPKTLEIWKKIIKDNDVFENYSRYSFGGLVGLKKETNSKFNHFVPMTFWLATYAKSMGLDTIKHIHMLGQSSRLAILTSVIIERVIGISITMDSSEILRFSPIEAKLPLIYKNPTNNEFELARDKDHLAHMLENNVALKHIDYNIEETLETLRTTGKVNNSDFVEIICQGIASTLEFANKFADDFKEALIEQDGIIPMFDLTIEDLKQYHPIFNHGRLAQELINNFRYAKEGYKYHRDGSPEAFEEYHKEVYTIIESYYK